MPQKPRQQSNNKSKKNGPRNNKIFNGSRPQIRQTASVLTYRTLSGASAVSATAFMICRTRVNFDISAFNEWIGFDPAFNFEAVPLRLRCVAVAPPAAVLANHPEIARYRMRLNTCVATIKPEISVDDEGKPDLVIPTSATVVNCATSVLPWNGSRKIVGSYNLTKIFANGNLAPNGSLFRAMLEFDAGTPDTKLLPLFPAVSLELTIDWACNFPTPALLSFDSCSFAKVDSISPSGIPEKEPFHTDSKIVRCSGGWFGDAFSSLDHASVSAFRQLSLGPSGIPVARLHFGESSKKQSSAEASASGSGSMQNQTV